MPDNKDPSLEERIEHLEQLVEKLQYTIERMQDRLSAPAPHREPLPAKRPPIPAAIKQNGSRSGRQRPSDRLPERLLAKTPVESPTSVSSRPMYSLDSEAWLNRIGLALVLLGIVFALRYMFEQEWFTPLLRVMSGTFVGLLMLALGLHMHRMRPRFGQGLLAGGITTFYVTAYAAYQMYSLVPYGVAFASMLLITVISFLLSARRDDTVMAILATLAGLATPFIMHSDKSHLLVLVVYTSLILLGAGAIYWFRGWRSLLFVSAIGSWLVVLFCYFNFAFGDETIASERWILQSGIFVSCALFWLMPFVRGYLRAQNPAKWPAPAQVKVVGYFFNHPALPLSVTTPLFTLIMSRLIWDLSDNLWGWILLLTSSIFGFLYLSIRLKDRKDLNHLAQMQGLTATIFLTAGIFLLYDAHFLLVALIIEAILIRIVARTMDDRLFALASHTIVFSLLGVVGKRLISMEAMTPFLYNTPALCEFIVLILVIFLATSIRTQWLSTAYFSISHILLLGWIYRQIIGMENGQILVTAVWGIYAIILLAVSFRSKWGVLRVASLCTLALVVTKLFLIDLETVEPLLRVLLFLSLGIVFIVMSYVLPNFFQRNATAPQETISEQASASRPEEAVPE